MRRRDFLGLSAGAIAASALKQESADAHSTFTVEASSLTPENLLAQKAAAVESLTSGIPADRRLNYLRDRARDLPDESQMYIPDDAELGRVYEKSVSELNQLGSSIPSVNEYGLFIYCDTNPDGSPFQRLYVVQKTAQNRLQFVKGYAVSTAANGFGNTPDSGQTPLGLHSILSGTHGVFGQVVSGLNKYKTMFNHVRIGIRDYYFVKGFGSGAGADAGNDIAEVVTDEYLITGPNTPAMRGIRVHGTNRSGERDSMGIWRTFLGGRKKSGGCIRMSSTDVRDLGLNGYAKLPQTIAGRRKSTAPGTAVMIHAPAIAPNATPPAPDPESEFVRPGVLRKAPPPAPGW